MVTGGSRGIGLATARALASRGAAVAITGTADGTLSAACRDLEREAAGRVLALRADVRSASEMANACDAAAPASAASMRSSTMRVSACSVP